MATAAGTRLRSIVWACAGLGMLAACSDPAIHEPEGPNLPTSNDRIVQAVTFGTLPANSSIRELRNDALGGFVFMGLVDGVYNIGNIGTDGQRSWSTPMDPHLSVKELALLPQNAPEMSGAIVWAGGRDRGDDDLLDDGTVGLMTSHGQELDTLMISRPQARIWINSVARIDSLNFIAVGGAFESGTYYPVVVRFEAGAGGTLTLQDSRVLTELEQENFNEVLVDEAQVSPGEFIIYVAGERLREGGGGWDTTVREMKAPRTGTGDYATEWTVPIEEEGDKDVWVASGALLLHDGTIFLAGSREVDKDKGPSGGGHWSAGLVGSISTAGHLNWTRTIICSRRTDQYNEICVVDGALYACGTYSSYYTVSTGQRHGFGLVSKFDPTTGEERNHIGVGPEMVWSGFHSACFSGGRFFGGGWTNGAIVDGGYQAWFAEVDVTVSDAGTPLGILGVQPAEPGAEAAEAAGKRTPGTWGD